jgi:hypothetical protein
VDGGGTLGLLAPNGEPFTGLFGSGWLKGDGRGGS